MEVKPCTKCGQIKPLSEFHRHANGKGWHGTKSHCKACVVSRVLGRKYTVRGYGPKYTAEERRMQRRWCVCGKRISKHQSQCTDCRTASKAGCTKEEYKTLRERYGDDWMRCMRRAMSQAKSDLIWQNQDVWTRKMGSIVSGLSARRRLPKRTSKRAKRTRLESSWDRGLRTAIRQATAKYKRSLLTEWHHKFATTTRNWRRKRQPMHNEA